MHIDEFPARQRHTDQQDNDAPQTRRLSGAHADNGRISEPEESISFGSERRRPPPLVLLVLALVVSGAAAVVVIVAHHHTAADRQTANHSSAAPRTPIGSPPPSPTGQAPGGYAAFCVGEPDCPGGSVPSALRRPTDHLTSTDGHCPTTPERIVEIGIGSAAGPGPVFAVTGDPHHHGTVVMTFPPNPESVFAHSQFSGQRIGWLIAPSYNGPILIRGRQLDGHLLVRFSTLDGQLLNELQLPPAPTSDGGWRQRFAYVRVRAPGCYAWQIDGTLFSYTIAFHVTSGT